MNNAIIIEPADNVAVAIEPIRRGETVSWSLPDGTPCTLTAQDDIPIYHKVATRSIAAGEKTIKYGEHIGEASTAIPAGSHVHEHNVASVREQLTEEE